MMKRKLILLSIIGLQACKSEPEDVKQKVEKIRVEDAAKEIRKEEQMTPKKTGQTKRKAANNLVKTMDCVHAIVGGDNSVPASTYVSQLENCSSVEIAFANWFAELSKDSACSLKEGTTESDLRLIESLLYNKAKKVISKMGLNREKETSCTFMQAAFGYIEYIEGGLEEKIVEVNATKAIEEIDAESSRVDTDEEFHELKERATSNLLESAKCFERLLGNNSTPPMRDRFQFDNCSSLDIAFLNWLAKLSKEISCSLQEIPKGYHLKAVTEAMYNKAKEVAILLDLNELYTQCSLLREAFDN